MGCGSSTGGDGKIQMQKTKLEGMDEFFDDVQGFIDEIYEIQDPIEDSKEALLESSDFEKIEGASVHHAAVGIVFALASQSNGSDVANLFKVTGSSPFLEINKSSASGGLLTSVDNLTKYIMALTAAKDRIEPLSEKAKGFAEKAPDLPDKVKGEINNAGDLGAMDKLRAVKNTSVNCKNMSKLPGLVKDFKDTIMGALADVQGAAKELEAKKSKLGDIGKKCSKDGKKTPKDCYLHSGDPIKVTDEDKKKHAAAKKRKEKKKAPAKK